MGICAGIDLCDEYIAVRICGEEDASVYPAVICREKKGENWYIGEEAYRVALSGEGVLTDKLLKLLLKDGTSTIMRRQYSGRDLVAQLVKKILEEKLSTGDFSCIEKLCVTVAGPDMEKLDRLRAAFLASGIPAGSLLFASHEESFVYYTLSRDRELYAGLVGMFDLCDESLCFYEMMMVRGMSKKCAVAESRSFEEAFHTDILRKDSGRVLGDRIVTDVAKRSMEGKVYSSVFLTGSGFDRVDWAPGFLNYICLRKKVLQEKGLFAIGASLAADDALREESRFPELIFCDATTTAEVSVEVLIHERKSKLVLTRAGARWYGLRAHLEVIPEDTDHLEFVTTPFDSSREKRSVRLDLSSLQELSERPARCTRIAVDMRFTAADHVEVKVTDMGFGEMWPASGTVICEEFTL